MNSSKSCLAVKRACWEGWYKSGSSGRYKAWLLFRVGANTCSNAATGVSVLTRDEFAGLWCAQVCWLRVNPYKGVLTRRRVFLWNPPPTPRQRPSSAYLIRCIISRDRRNYQKNVSRQKSPCLMSAVKLTSIGPKVIYMSVKLAFEKAQRHACVQLTHSAENELTTMPRVSINKGFCML